MKDRFRNVAGAFFWPGMCFRHGHYQTGEVEISPGHIQMVDNGCPRCHAVSDRFKRMKVYKKEKALAEKIAAMSDRELAEAAFRLTLELADRKSDK